MSNPPVADFTYSSSADEQFSKCVLHNETDTDLS